MHGLAPIRVLVTHEEHIVDAGLKATLAKQPGYELVTTEWANKTGIEVTSWLRQLNVDVVITDYDRGLSLARTIQIGRGQSCSKSLRTVIVTSRITPAEIRNALKNGVDGYLPSASPESEFLDAVRKVHMSIRHVSEPLAQALMENMLAEQLTPRETEVLRLAALGLANKVIATRLGIELGTVKCHMKAIMEKLQVCNRTEAVVIANQRGLLTPDCDPFVAEKHLERIAASRSQNLNTQRLVESRWS